MSQKVLLVVFLVISILIQVCSCSNLIRREQDKLDRNLKIIRRDFNKLIENVEDFAADFLKQIQETGDVFGTDYNWEDGQEATTKPIKDHVSNQPQTSGFTNDGTTIPPLIDLYRYKMINEIKKRRTRSVEGIIPNNNIDNRLPAPMNLIEGEQNRLSVPLQRPVMMLRDNGEQSDILGAESISNQQQTNNNKQDSGQICASVTQKEVAMDKQKLEELKAEVKKLNELVVLLKDQQNLIESIDGEDLNENSFLYKTLSDLERARKKKIENQVIKPKTDPLEELNLKLMLTGENLNDTKEMLLKEQQKEAVLEAELKRQNTELKFLKVMMEKLYDKNNAMADTPKEKHLRNNDYEDIDSILGSANYMKSSKGMEKFLKALTPDKQDLSGLISEKELSKLKETGRRTERTGTSGLEIENPNKQWDEETKELKKQILSLVETNSNPHKMSLPKTRESDVDHDAMIKDKLDKIFKEVHEAYIDKNNPFRRKNQKYEDDISRIQTENALMQIAKNDPNRYKMFGMQSRESVPQDNRRQKILSFINNGNIKNNDSSPTDFARASKTDDMEFKLKLIDMLTNEGKSTDRDKQLNVMKQLFLEPEKKSSDDLALETLIELAKDKQEPQTGFQASIRNLIKQLNEKPQSKSDDFTIESELRQLQKAINSLRPKENDGLNSFNFGINRRQQDDAQNFQSMLNQIITQNGAGQNNLITQPPVNIPSSSGINSLGSNSYVSPAVQQLLNQYLSTGNINSYSSAHRQQPQYSYSNPIINYASPIPTNSYDYAPNPYNFLNNNAYKYSPSTYYGAAYYNGGSNPQNQYLTQLYSAPQAPLYSTNYQPSKTNNYHQNLPAKSGYYGSPLSQGNDANNYVRPFFQSNSGGSYQGYNYGSKSYAGPSVDQSYGNGQASEQHRYALITDLTQQIQNLEDVIKNLNRGGEYSQNEYDKSTVASLEQRIYELKGVIKSLNQQPSYQPSPPASTTYNSLPSYPQPVYTPPQPASPYRGSNLPVQQPEQTQPSTVPQYQPESASHMSEGYQPPSNTPSASYQPKEALRESARKRLGKNEEILKRRKRQTEEHGGPNMVFRPTEGNADINLAVSQGDVNRPAARYELGDDALTQVANLFHSYLEESLTQPQNDPSINEKTRSSSTNNLDGLQRQLDALKLQLESRKSSARPLHNFYGSPATYGYSNNNNYAYPSYGNIHQVQKIDTKKDLLGEIVLKILKKLFNSLPTILSGVFGNLVTSVGNSYGDSYSSLQTVLGNLGYVGFFPLILVRVLESFTTIFGQLKKNSLFRQFLLPALVLGLVGGAILFLIFFFQQDEPYGYIDYQNNDYYPRYQGETYRNRYAPITNTEYNNNIYREAISYYRPDQYNVIDTDHRQPYYNKVYAASTFRENNGDNGYYGRPVLPYSRGYYEYFSNNLNKS